MSDNKKDILITSGVMSAIVLLCIWFHFVDDSWIVGHPVDTEIIQITDILLLIGIIIIYLIFAFTGWLLKHGRARG